MHHAARVASLSDLVKAYKIYPQVLENVRVTDKKEAQNDPDVQAKVQEVADILGTSGRILVRESGTEPVVRVMVEAKTEEQCRELVDSVVKVIKDKGYAV